MEMAKLKLQNGEYMPVIGLGGSIFPKEAEEIEGMVESALKLGYRHFDTATLYFTEPFIGNALRKWIITGQGKREDLFIVTKLPQIGMRPDKVRQFMMSSLRNLQTDYVDVYLCHWPIGIEYVSETDVLPRGEDGILRYDFKTDIIAVWRQMEKQVEMGFAKAIGLSNFNISQIERILKVAKIPPSVIQVEVHTHHQQNKLREFCEMHNIRVIAYYPLGGLGRRFYPVQFQITPIPALFDDEIVKELSKKYGKTPAQIVLRFLTQLNIAIIPQSTVTVRQKENLSITNFSISAEDMEKMKALDKGEAGKVCLGFRGCAAHPEYPFETKLNC